MTDLHYPATLGDGTRTMAFNANRGNPWHFLGTPVTHDMDIDQALDLIGVSDEVIEPVTLRSDPIHGLSAYHAIGDLEEIDFLQGIKSSVFGTMGAASPGYQITTRREILEQAYEITGLSQDSDTQAYIDIVGNLGSKGEIFFAYVKVPDLVIDPNGVADVIERGLYVATSFNSTLKNTIGWSNVRIACSNALMVALKNLTQTISVRHTRNSAERINQAVVALQYAGAVEQQLKARAEQMLRVDGETALNSILDHFFDISDEGLGERARDTRINTRGDIRMLYNGPGNVSAELVGENGWAAYQAFAEWADHERPVRGTKDVQVRRAQSAVLPGTVTQDKIRASELVLALAA